MAPASASSTRRPSSLTTNRPQSWILVSPAGAIAGSLGKIGLSLDGRRLYVTNSLYSTWDNQFYPDMSSWLLRVNCSPDGGMQVDSDFFVDLHDRPNGPARAHDVRLQGGDCMTEIFQ